MVNCLFNKIDFYQGFSEKKLEIKSCQISCCFCSVAKLCLTFCYPVDCSKPGFLSLTTSCSLPRFVAVQSVMPSNCLILSSVQSLSLVPLCNLMDCSMPGFPVHHQLPELAQTNVHRVSDAIQPSHSLLSPLLLPSVFPSIRVFSKESVLPIR